MAEDGGPVDQEREPRGGLHWDEVERERRLRALRDLAAEHSGAPVMGSGATDVPTPPRELPVPPAPRPPVPARRTRGRLVVVSILVLVVIVVAAGLAAHALTQPTIKRTATGVSTVHLVPGEDQLGCPVDVAWSPDGSRVAVLGYVHDCPDSGGDGSPYKPGLVNIYDVAHGTLVSRFQPDTAILKQGAGITLTPTALPSANYVGAAFVQYDSILWSPDGKTLAIPFTVRLDPAFTRQPATVVDRLPPSSNAPTIAGVLLTAPSGTTQHLVTAPYTPSDGRIEWDLAAGKLVNPSLMLPPALAYTWNSDGALTPDMPLTPSALQAATPGAIGNPSGGTSFSLWQPGDASPAYTQGSQRLVAVSDVYLWYANFAAWSPDQRYLITSGYAGGRVALPDHPAPDPQALAAARATQAPLLPPRGPAMRRLYDEMGPQPDGTYAPAQHLAWRPDGKVLAAEAEVFYDTNQQVGQVTDTAVVLYDTATGKKLTTLTPRADLQYQSGNYFTGAFLWMRWSPDGSHLLLMDGYLGTLTIWGPSTLPK